MLNAEKFKKEILNIVNDDFYIAVNKNDPNGVSKCGSFPCADCMFSKEENGKPRCTKNRINWLLSEYKEPVKLTKSEYSLLRHVYKLDYKYIARDENGDISLYLDEPDKDLLTEIWHGKEYEFTLFNNLFPFIKWEDKEPTLIKEVLNNCEVIEDD